MLLCALFPSALTLAVLRQCAYQPEIASGPVSKRMITKNGQRSDLLFSQNLT